MKFPHVFKMISVRPLLAVAGLLASCVVAVAAPYQPRLVAVPKDAPYVRPDGSVYIVGNDGMRSEEHTSELQSPDHLVCRLLLEKKKNIYVDPSKSVLCRFVVK